jgi:hypothetical protein
MIAGQFVRVLFRGRIKDTAGRNSRKVSYPGKPWPSQTFASTQSQVAGTARLTAWQESPVKCWILVQPVGYNAT